MKSFFKTFFAAFLALVIFTVIGIFVLIGFIVSATSADKPVVGSNAVLVLDLSNHFKEQKQENPLGVLIDETVIEAPSLYDVIRMVRHAKTDSSIKGIYVSCARNANGFAASE